MSVTVQPGISSRMAQKAGGREIVMVADAKFPAITAQNVGREIYHGRQDVVRIVGDKRSLRKIAWIFQKVPDMFDIRFQCASLLVSRTPERRTRRRYSQAGKTALKAAAFIPLKRQTKICAPNRKPC